MCDFFPPEIILLILEHVFTARCQRGLASVKRVCKLFRYMASSSRFRFESPEAYDITLNEIQHHSDFNFPPNYEKCSGAEYPHFKRKYSRNEAINRLNFCCLRKMQLFVDTNCKTYYASRWDYDNNARVNSINPFTVIGVPSFTMVYENDWTTRSPFLQTAFRQKLPDLFKTMVEKQPANTARDRLEAIINIIRENFPGALGVKLRNHQFIRL